MPSQPHAVHNKITDIEYSAKYEDAQYEYRHVLLPESIAKFLPTVGYNRQPRLLSEGEWRKLGVQQSRGGVHYELHRPEPHVLLFRRPLGTDPSTGKIPESALDRVIARLETCDLKPTSPAKADDNGGGSTAKLEEEVVSIEKQI